MSEKNARTSTSAGASGPSAPKAPSPAALFSAATADLSASGAAAAAASAATPAPSKTRSCIVCRNRKVRCDRQSPCSNCRQAGITCIVPSSKDRAPRWARRLERYTQNTASPASTASTTAHPPSTAPAAAVASGPQAAPSQNAPQATMDRLRSLEGLVNELREQLERANAAAAQSQGSPGTSSTGVTTGAGSVRESTGSPQDHQNRAATGTSSTGLQKHFGRLVVQDARRDHFIGDGFWSRISDELEGLKRDAAAPFGGDKDTSEDDDIDDKSPPSTHESERAPSERHGFLFRHNLAGPSPDLQQFRPLPSQVPFLLDVFAENINLICGLLHMPTVTKMLREKRTIDMSHLSPANEALMFAIYYAAVTSMEEEDVVANFGSTTKRELNLQFRLGLEHALAKADFLTHPNLTIVQAFAVFLFLLRRHDDPRFVWMLTGLGIRMAQSLGLHRDGTHFPSLSPFEVEMRRRVWWALVMIDIRAAEDQASEYTIANGSFDTRLPLNVADADLDPDSKEPLVERQALTEVSLALVSYETAVVVREMMAPRGAGEEPPSIDDQARLLSNVYEKLERNYLRYATESENIVYWVGVVVHRLLIAKMTLLIYLPALFSSPSERFSDAIRDKLLTAALEVAEHNHALNSEVEARHWRWVFQTYTHWYAIVYLLIEASGRRPWSPIVERAWIALHSPWLIPTARVGEKNAHVWLPLRKLMARVRGYREAEIQRLTRSDEQTLAQLEQGDGRIPTPATAGPSSAADTEQVFRQHWRSLVSGSGAAAEAQQQRQGTFTDSGSGSGGVVSSGHTPSGQTGFEMNPALSQGVPADSASPQGGGTMPWLWPAEEVLGDASLGLSAPMDLDIDLNMDWNSWLENAATMEASW